MLRHITEHRIERRVVDWDLKKKSFLDRPHFAREARRAEDALGGAGSAFHACRRGAKETV